MTDIFHRLFYHIYKPLLKGESKSTAPITACFVMTTLACLNIMSVIFIFTLLKIDFTSLFNGKDNKIYIIIMYIVMSIFNYLYFISGDRCISIIKEYSKKPLQERKRGARLNPFVWFRFHCVDLCFSSLAGDVRVINN